MPQFREANLKMVRFAARERVQQRSHEQVPVPRILDDTVEVTSLVPQERVQQRTVDVPMLQRTTEQIEDALQYPEGTDEMVRSVSRERVQHRIAEQIEDPPQFVEETVEVVRLVPQERVQWINEQMVKVFSGKEEFLTQTHELKMQQEGNFEKIDALALRRVFGSIRVFF